MLPRDYTKQIETVREGCLHWIGKAGGEIGLHQSYSYFEHIVAECKVGERVPGGSGALFEVGGGGEELLGFFEAWHFRVKIA